MLMRALQGVLEGVLEDVSVSTHVIEMKIPLTTVE